MTPGTQLGFKGLTARTKPELRGEAGRNTHVFAITTIQAAQTIVSEDDPPTSVESLLHGPP